MGTLEIKWLLQLNTKQITVFRILPLDSGSNSTLAQIEENGIKTFSVFFSGGSGDMPPMSLTILNFGNTT